MVSGPGATGLVSGGIARHAAALDVPGVGRTLTAKRQARHFTTLDCRRKTSTARECPRSSAISSLYLDTGTIKRGAAATASTAPSASTGPVRVGQDGSQGGGPCVMSSWTAASSDCSRPVNNYVHVKTADLYRPNARLTPERQGYQVLTPFGKLGYSRLYIKIDSPATRCSWRVNGRREHNAPGGRGFYYGFIGYTLTHW